MKYEKILKEKYSIHLIDTNRFKTISVNVVFSNEFKKSDIPYISLLIKILLSSTKKHKTPSKIAVHGEELYGAEVFSESKIIGDIERMSISLEFLNPKYTSDQMTHKSFNFLKECLLEPNIVNDKFDEKIFDINKNNLLLEIKSIKDNSNLKANIKFKSIMFSNNSLGYSLYNNIKDLENITNEELYKFYLNVLKTFKIDIFLVGDMSRKKDYLKEIGTIFNKIDNSFRDKLSFDCKELDNKFRKFRDKENINQSQLFIGYSFKNLTQYEKEYVLNFYNSLLGGINNSFLFTEVREKNSLCYSVNSIISKNPESIIVETVTSKNNEEIALKLIDKCISNMSNKNKIEVLFDTAKENISTALNMFYDDKFLMMNHYYKKEFKSVDDIEIQREKYLNIECEDIINLNKKIKKNTLYVLEGKNDK